ncbi:histidine kinase [Cellulosimicrobium sp. KWT-B]|uniref:histidine kinase n=1 Tax=Cellulosimicrobium sp. KWT-B TaxID=1981152 RepID=UPI000A3283F1|nr:histidine kinase [Cellulosimicrobium sp. KWT-B]
MDLTPYVDDLQDRLAAAADAAGDDSRRLAERLTAPLDAAVRLVLLDALSAAAGEISAELAPGSVDVRLRGGAPEFVVAVPAVAPAPPEALVPASTPAAPAGPAPADVEAGATTRTTLRLPDHLKTQAETAAARDGVSVNTWLVRAVAAALEQSTGRPAAQARPQQRGSARVTGWVR